MFFGLNCLLNQYSPHCYIHLCFIFDLFVTTISIFSSFFGNQALRSILFSCFNEPYDVVHDKLRSAFILGTLSIGFCERYIVFTLLFQFLLQFLLQFPSLYSYDSHFYFFYGLIIPL